jgi:hypothetical protein
MIIWDMMVRTTQKKSTRRVRKSCFLQFSGVVRSREHQQMHLNDQRMEFRTLTQSTQYSLWCHGWEISFFQDFNWKIIELHTVDLSAKHVWLPEPLRVVRAVILVPPAAETIGWSSTQLGLHCLPSSFCHSKCGSYPSFVEKKSEIPWVFMRVFHVCVK